MEKKERNSGEKNFLSNLGIEWKKNKKTYHFVFIQSFDPICGENIYKNSRKIDLEVIFGRRLRLASAMCVFMICFEDKFIIRVHCKRQLQSCGLNFIF